MHVTNNLCPQLFVAWDCFELGRLAYNEEDFYHTVMWMEEALIRLRKGGDNQAVNLGSVLDYLAFAYYKVVFLNKLIFYFTLKAQFEILKLT